MDQSITLSDVNRINGITGETVERFNNTRTVSCRSSRAIRFRRWYRFSIWRQAWDLLNLREKFHFGGNLIEFNLHLTEVLRKRDLRARNFLFPKRLCNSVRRIFISIIHSDRNWRYLILISNFQIWILFRFEVSLFLIELNIGIVYIEISSASVLSRISKIFYTRLYHHKKCHSFKIFLFFQISHTYIKLNYNNFLPFSRDFLYLPYFENFFLYTHNISLSSKSFSPKFNCTNCIFIICIYPRSILIPRTFTFL